MFIDLGLIGVYSTDVVTCVFVGVLLCNVNWFDFYIWLQLFVLAWHFALGCLLVLLGLCLLGLVYSCPCFVVLVVS